MSEEGLTETDNNLIYIGKPIEMDDEKFLTQLKRLEEAYRLEALDMKEIVAEIVPYLRFAFQRIIEEGQRNRPDCGIITEQPYQREARPNNNVYQPMLLDKTHRVHKFVRKTGFEHTKRRNQQHNRRHYGKHDSRRH